ncbi:AAA-associated domain-containing protein [Candidatus Micrarchaeota archaeon]|nr:AAA-associated domain-containing protein [Candidatus Micrarchaeota archaeon]
MVKHKLIPLPHANVGEVLGLQEAIYSYGGRVKISFIVDEFRLSFDDLGDVIDMAELLELVKVHEGEIHLTLYGEAIVLGKIDDKKGLLRKRLVKIEIFKIILSMIKKHGKVSWDQIVERLRENEYAIEDPIMFKKIVIGWGSYAELFEYYGDGQIFTAVGTNKEGKERK